METQEANGKVSVYISTMPTAHNHKDKHQNTKAPWPLHPGPPKLHKGISIKLNPGAIPAEALGRGRGTPRRGLLCPPTKGRGHSRVPPGAVLPKISQTARGALYKGWETGRHRSPTVGKALRSSLSTGLKQSWLPLAKWSKEARGGLPKCSHKEQGGEGGQVPSDCQPQKPDPVPSSQTA